MLSQISKDEREMQDLIMTRRLLNQYLRPLPTLLTMAQGQVKKEKLISLT